MAAGRPLPAGYRGAWESRLRLIRPRDPAVKVEVETVTRVVKRLKQQGWLDQDGKQYRVPAEG